MTLGIRGRLYGIVGVFAVGLIAVVWLLLSQEFDALKTRRQQELKGLVETAFSLVNAQYVLTQSGNDLGGRRQIPSRGRDPHAALSRGQLLLDQRSASDDGGPSDPA